MGPSVSEHPVALLEHTRGPRWSSRKSMLSSRVERVEKLYCGLFEVATVSRHDHEAVHERRRGDETVLDRHGTTGRTQPRDKLRPPKSRHCLPRQTVQLTDAPRKPRFELRSAAAFRQETNAEPDLAQDDRIDDELALVASQPVDHMRVWIGPRGLAKDVRVDEKLHSSSVDSDEMGTKKSLAGQ